MIKKAMSLLSKNDRKKLNHIYAIILVHTLLELLGISIILPIVSLIIGTNGDYSNSPILSYIEKITGINGEHKLLTLTLLILVIVYFVKSCFNVFYRYSISKFSLEYSNDLTNRLMLTYLSMPYEYHRNNSSSVLMEKTFYDIEHIVSTIKEILNLSIKFLTFVGIFAYLLTVNYKITLFIVFFLISFAFIVVRIIKPETKILAKQIRKFDSDNFKYLGQAYAGIKEAKIFGTEKIMAKEFYKNEQEKNKLILKHNILNSFPLSFIEFVGILGICITLFIFNNVMGVDDTTIISNLSVIVYGMIVLLPVVITFSSSMNNIDFYSKSVNDICEDIKKAKEYDELFKPESKQNFVFDKLIEFKNVSFAYQDSPDINVLENVNLSIKKNSIVYLLGPSGGGKSTLLDLLLGLFIPSEGEIVVDGKDISNSSIAWRKNISYIPQNIYLLDDTIENNIAYGSIEEEIDIDRINKVLKNAELFDFVQSLPKKEKTMVGENGVRLSGGQRQRIGIARALYRNANIIICDEATNAIDYKTANKIFENIYNLKDNHTLIIATHRSDSIKNSDDIYVVDGNNVKLK